MAIDVRAARREDFAAWLPLWEGYNEIGEGGASPAEQAQARQVWAALHDAMAPMECLLGTVGDAPAGFAHLVFHSDTAHPPHVCLLKDLFTAPVARGQGLGSAMLAAALDRARGAGAASIYWQTRATNAAAMRLYDRVAERTNYVTYVRPLG